MSFLGSFVGRLVGRWLGDAVSQVAARLRGVVRQVDARGVLRVAHPGGTLAAGPFVGRVRQASAGAAVAAVVSSSRCREVA